MSRLLANVSPPRARRGAVVAAPSGNREYQFNWTRDAALTMREVTDQERFKAYARYNWRTIKTPTQAGLGEPKFELDGRGYHHVWGRPQNDGPAIRAMTSLAQAERMLERGDEAYVRRVLYGGGLPARKKRGYVPSVLLGVPRAATPDNSGKYEFFRAPTVPGELAKARVAGARASGTIIKADLDYIADHFRDPSFDIWEEEKADHFYTRSVQHTALIRGAKLARQLGDVESASRYSAIAGELKSMLDAHWDARYGLVRASLNRLGDQGIQHKWTGLDSSVILAVNHTYGDGSPFSALDDRLLSTAALLEKDFRAKYPINFARKGAVAIGRYPEDRYTGQPGQDRDEGGNPWVITTHAFAEYYYHVAAELRAAKTLRITTLNRPFFLHVLGHPPDSQELAVGTELATRKEIEPLRRAVLRTGDGFLEVVRELFTDPAGGAMPQSEQIQRESGQPVGAVELTWNYASLLSAIRVRSEAIGPGRPPR